MNLNTQYSVIGGSAGAFVLVLIALFLSLTGDEPTPISPIGEQIVPIQTNDDSTGETNNRSGNLRELPSRSEPEEIVESDEPTATSDSPSTDVQSSSSGGGSRSGGGGGGGSNNGDNEDDEDSSSHTPGTWASIEATYR